MGRYGCEHRIVQDLQEWTMEAAAPLPLPLADIVWVERCGVTVDLQTGERFYPTDDWADFAERWLWEMVRRGERPEGRRLAAAIQRASDYGWNGEMALVAAQVLLDRAMRKICVAQVA